MHSIDEEIGIIDGAICRYLDNIDNSTRGLVSQDMLAQLIRLVEQIMLKYFSPYTDIDDTEENIEKATEYAQTSGYLKNLYRFRKYLDIVAARYTLDEEGSERLMLKYYDYLLEIKKLLKKDFDKEILHNLNKFPLNLDTALQEYYSKIADKINRYPASLNAKGDKYYIQKIKPFYVKGDKYLEVTFTPAKDTENKSERVIAFTKLPVIGNYASVFSFVNESIEILGKTMPILLITGWEVSIRACEFKNFSAIITGNKSDINYPERRAICNFLTEERFTLTEIMDFPDTYYWRVSESWRAESRTHVFFDTLDKCRRIIRAEKRWQNILRYLLYGMHNATIRDQWADEPNAKLSTLYLQYGSIQFDELPFIMSPIKHNPRQNALYNSIKTESRKHELLARQLKNNAEIRGTIFTPINDLANYGDIDALRRTYNATVYYKDKVKNKLVIEDGYAYLNEYKLDTCEIINKLLKLSNVPDPEYSDNIDFWLLFDDYKVDSPEKVEILRRMFSESAVAAIYGSAGVGKSTLINHISHFYEDKKKLYLAHTNPAIDNLKRRVTADESNCEFYTIAKYLKSGSRFLKYDLLVIDECSTVSNTDMKQILDTTNFERILLVGDTFQISSIRFGNWFTALQSFLPERSVFELMHPYRTTDQHLLDLWAKVRIMDDTVQEVINKQSRSLKVDESLFTAISEDEAVLCLNYDGLYGINNINRFLQESNPNPAYEWNVQQYKVGDPVLFLENNRFRPVIYNNLRGKIAGIAKANEGTAAEKIIFDIELYTTVDPDDLTFIPLEYIETLDNGHSVVRFDVNKNKSADEDDDGNTASTIVPFQIAYAVSIHKAQGLEFSSVKIVITDEVDELITHNIFYTAITRARDDLKIYWTAEVEKKILENIRPRNIDSDVEILRKYITPPEEEIQLPF